jgi:Flp pilus assembly protein TadD
VRQKELSTSAAYEDALTARTRLHGNDAAQSASDQVEQYRAFCLFALGRTGEAQAIAEALISASPLVEIDAADASYPD